ncbi:nitrate transporter [Stappia sp. GBMRC 2046]|uniref:Nitrate transporter n=1 Tax=Stappia sediminis TaxID=2692190 RepID=A0A7X3LWC8_9HYPH|nr:nitrate transporter [Stappia sediminis]
MPDHQIIAGFLPLLDSAILVAAREKGFAEGEGVDLSLVRETSWANIRDRMAVGHFHAAQMLAPMPIASNLGLTPLAVPLAAPMVLGLGGNAITVSNALWARMAEAGATPDLDPASTGKALKSIIAERASTGEARLRFAVVHPHSGHNYELRYWLAACGIDPDEDVEILIAPPPLLPDAMSNGRIDGFCVGEPWNTVAVRAGSGRIATVKARIWRSSPEKVLALHADWMGENEAATHALLRALYRAAAWCGASWNHQELAEILAREDYLGVSPQAIMPALGGQLGLGGGEIAEVRDFFVPFASAATFPWKSHALWFYSQMVRWGQCSFSKDHLETVESSFRPDIYRAALGPIGAAIPAADSKVEGARIHAGAIETDAGKLQVLADGFFDGETFDPGAIEDYLARP